MSSRTSVSLDNDTGGVDGQHTALGLMHLKKLFSEYIHSCQTLSDEEQDDKLYNMLPLFCKVSSITSSSNINKNNF